MSKQANRAIALKYDGEQAPTLTAKGDDELAEAIINIAREHQVPIYENAELVRLLARLELGDSIPESLYRTIAEIIAFAWYLKGKVPKDFYQRRPKTVRYSWNTRATKARQKPATAAVAPAASTQH